MKKDKKQAESGHKIILKLARCFPDGMDKEAIIGHLEIFKAIVLKTMFDGVE